MDGEQDRPATPSGLLAALRSTADTRPEAPAVRTEERTISYATLCSAVARLAAELAGAGVGPGDRVAVLLPNRPELIAAYYGVLQVGGVVVPLNPAQEPGTVAGQLSHHLPRAVLQSPELPAGARAVVAEAATQTGAAVLVLGPELFGTPAGPPAVEIGPGPGPSAAVLAYRATTGDPVAVQLTHSALAAAASTLASSVLRLTPADTLLSGFPLHTVLGQTCALNAVVAAGACLSLPARFDPGVLTRVMTEHGVTVLAAFPALLPTLHRAIAGAAGDLALRTVLGAGGAPVPDRWRKAISEAYGCELLACYGPPEAAALVCAIPPGTPAKPGSVGTAVAGMEIRVGDAKHAAPPGATGELLVRGDHVMAGYWDDEAASERVLRDGWLRTGQAAQLDDEGSLYLTDGGWVGRLTGPRPGRRGRLRRWWGRSGR